MSEAILDWKEAMARVDTTRGLYVKLLRNFIETERAVRWFHSFTSCWP